MADIEQVIVTRLTSFAGLSALIGQRVYPKRSPQSPTLPYVTYQAVSGSSQQFLNDPTDVAMPRIQVDAWARSHESARAVSGQIVAALHLWRDNTTTPRVIESKLEGEPQDIDEPDVNLHRVSQDFEVWYHRA